MLSGTEVLDWMTGIEILSLDFARPIYHELGVGVSCEETLRGLSRDTLLGRYSDQQDPFRLDVWAEPETTRVVWVEPFLGALDRSLGRIEKNRVIRWVMFVHSDDKDRNPWMLYEDLFATWASIFRREGVDGIGFSADAAIIANKLKAAFNLTEPEDTLRKQRSRPLTDWDEPRFTRLGLRDIPEDSDFFPFVDGLLLSIWMARFQGFWQWMSSFITSEDLNRIADTARKVADEKQIRYCRPEQLPLPQFDNHPRQPPLTRVSLPSPKSGA